jgi:hypothetical protein
VFFQVLSHQGESDCGSDVALPLHPAVTGNLTQNPPPLKHTKLSRISLSILTLLTFFSGIVRDDVSETKYLKLAQKKQFDCVGQIFKGEMFSGSCVLISDRILLSAAHVFIDHDSRTDTIKINGQTIFVYIPINIRVTNVSRLYVLFMGQKVKVKRIIIHPNYLDSLTKGSCDIALLELENPLTNISTANLSTGYDELKSNVVGVGYGSSGPANRPDLVKQQSKKIAGQNVIDSIAGLEYMGNKTLLLCDFDHPVRKDCNKMGNSKPRPLEYICSGGDSGGGLFRKKGKRWELIGICHSNVTDINQEVKTGYYGQTMEWTRVSAFVNWIMQTK